MEATKGNGINNLWIMFITHDHQGPSSEHPEFWVRVVSKSSPLWWFLGSHTDNSLGVPWQPVLRTCLGPELNPWWGELRPCMPLELPPNLKTNKKSTITCMLAFVIMKACVSNRKLRCLKVCLMTFTPPDVPGRRPCPVLEDLPPVFLCALSVCFWVSALPWPKTLTSLKWQSPEPITVCWRWAGFVTLFASVWSSVQIQKSFGLNVHD